MHQRTARVTVLRRKSRAAQWRPHQMLDLRARCSDSLIDAMYHVCSSCICHAVPYHAPLAPTLICHGTITLSLLSWPLIRAVNRISNLLPQNVRWLNSWLVTQRRPAVKLAPTRLLLHCSSRVSSPGNGRVFFSYSRTLNATRGLVTGWSRCEINDS